MPRLPRRLGYGEEASLVEHLGELRTRLLISAGAVLAGFIVAYALHEHLIDWLRDPLPAEYEDNLVTLGVTEPFFTAVSVSLYAAVAAALPVLLWQIWSFLAPAFQPHVQRVVMVYVFFATVLFAAGVAFAYFVIMPPALDFLTSYDEAVYNTQLRASYYFSFVSMMLLLVALAFELPIFILALVRLGILSSARLRRNRRTGYVLVLVMAVLFPTADPVSLAFEIVPLLALFEGSIWLSVLLERRWQRAAARAAAGEA